MLLSLLPVLGIVLMLSPSQARPDHKADMAPTIIHGTDTPSVRPYLVSIQVEERFYKQHVCGGSLVAPNKILSAAHCLRAWKRPGFEYYAKVGYINIGMAVEDGDGRQTIKIIDAKPHADYKPNTGGEHNDVVIFTLEKPVELKPGVVELVKRSSLSAADLLGKTVELDGWGVKSSEERPPPTEKLQHIELKVVDDEECKKAFRPNWILADQHICAISSAAEPKPDTCRGDSGSPLMYQGEQVGILSFGSPECGINDPSVYGSVAAFKSFIDSNI